MNDDMRLLFHQLSELPPDERERALAEAQIAPEDRAELQSLLRFDTGEAPWLADCVADAAEEVLHDTAAGGSGRCGPYQLVRLLGRGGMGAVYLAERTDGEIQQQVAIKLLPGDGARPTWRNRFLKERQLLASLHHPSIVRVLDAGHTADHRPYLVMEFVEGVALDAFADGLDLRAILYLFLEVCDAVAHAHRNLIVHRDLKPSNILVDGSGRPKLLDFGIAKILDAAEDATWTSDRLLTPDYASPEQVRGGNQTTATDIYSLAALLYRLVTGTSPHTIGKETREERLAAIISEDPPPASRLKPDLPRDLDFVLAKALRKDPADRYASVDALAEDIRAFLDHRPVRARSGNAAYRVRKFARRYWIPTTAAAAAFVSLAVGLTLSLHERNLAQRRFLDVRQIANELFLVEQDINTLPGATAARERIVRTSLLYLERLSKDAGGDPALMAEIAGGYRRVAQVQGVFRGTNLGRPADARASLAKAEKLYRDLWKAMPNDRQRVRDLMETIDMQGRIAYAARELPNLESRTAELQTLLAVYEPLAAAGPADWTFLATTYDSLSVAVGEISRLDEAVTFALRSIEYRRKVAGHDKTTGPRGGLANSLLTYARMCRNAGRLADAHAASTESVGLLEGILVEEPANYKIRLNLANTLISVGRVLGDADTPSLGRVDDAIPYFERGLTIGREVMASDAQEAMARYNHSLGDWRLADAIRDRDPARALKAYDEAIRLLRAEKAGNFSRDIPLVNVLAESAFPLIRLHRSDEARLRLNEAAQIAAPHLKNVSQASLYCREVLSRAEADWALASGRPRDAAALHREFLKEVESSKVPGFDSSRELGSAFTLARRYYLLAEALRAAGDDAQAAQVESKRRELVGIWKEKLPGTSGVETALLRN